MPLRRLGLLFSVYILLRLLKFALLFKCSYTPCKSLSQNMMGSQFSNKLSSFITTVIIEKNQLYLLRRILRLFQQKHCILSWETHRALSSVARKTIEKSRETNFHKSLASYLKVSSNKQYSNFQTLYLEITGQKKAGAPFF